MIDPKQLYLDLIIDYEPYVNLSEHESLTESEMLYNLIEIKENNFDIDTDDIIIERFNDLINLFKSMGINPYYD